MLRRLRENQGLRGTLLISPALLWMIVLLVVPLILIVITSFGGRDPDGNVIYGFGLDNYARLTGHTGECRDAGHYLSSLWQALHRPGRTGGACFDPQ